MSTVFRQFPAFLFLAAALVGIWRSMGYPPGPPNVPGPGVVPLWLAVTLAIVSLTLLARGFGVGRRDAVSGANEPAGQTDPTVVLRLVQLLTAVAVYAFVMPLLGFIVTTTLLSLVALRVFGHRGALHAVPTRWPVRSCFIWFSKN